jgi:phosphoribosylglycinamide formyltransferase 1
MKRRVAILISGRGSNMAALIKAAQAGDYPAEIAVVISNRADAFGLERAKASGVATVVIESKPFGKDRAGFETALQAALDRYKTELICLGGFMRLFTADFVQRWYGRMLNIHPSLLPSFRGLHVHEQAIAAGVKISGCTVHIVRPAVDDGPILVQAAVPLAADDTPETLAARVLEAEHRVYPLAVRLIAEKRVRIAGDRALIDGVPAPAAPLLSPAD